MLSDAWQSSSNDARDLFLKTGPGKTLAYLDEWITAAENNRDALRGLVLVAQESRKKINGLWEDYKKDIEDAKNVGFGTTARIWLTRYDLIRGGEEYEAAMDEHREQQIQEVRKRYNREAQQLASDTATHYFEYLTKNGYGPPFEPMNATMNIPGEGLWSRIPSGPSGPPGMPNAGAPPSVGTVQATTGHEPDRRTAAGPVPGSIHRPARRAHGSGRHTRYHPAAGPARGRPYPASRAGGATTDRPGRGGRGRRGREPATDAIRRTRRRRAPCRAAGRTPQRRAAAPDAGRAARCRLGAWRWRDAARGAAAGAAGAEPSHQPGRPRRWPEQLRPAWATRARPAPGAARR